MGHPGCGRARAPAIEESISGIDYSKPIRIHIGLANEACRDVHTMNSPTDDEPIKLHGNIHS